MAGVHDRELVHPETREEWRAWLEANHATSTGCWFLRWRSETGRPAVDYEHAVEEALCFGWVDSQIKRLDAERNALLMTPRKPGSGWARTNKVRIERLASAGLIAEAGQAVIQAAKADGTWTLLDDVEDLIVPADLSAAFDAYPGAGAFWDTLPVSPRKMMLTWVVMAKTPPTRERRVNEIAARAAEGERAGPARQ